MILYRKRDLNKIGIYAIVNCIDNKMYVGKSINIYSRIKDHITRLNTKNRDENTYLTKAWHKYGKENFKYIILEYLDLFDENLLANRELYWIVKLNTINKKFGYNLRLDTETKCLVTEYTKKRLSKSRKERETKYPTLSKDIGKKISNFWKNNSDIKNQMRIRVSEKKIQYYVIQYSKDGNFIKKWDSIKEILKENPSYKWQNIYSVCNGYKPSIYGYIWVKFKITNEDIVRSLEKSKIESSEVINL